MKPFHIIFKMYERTVYTCVATATDEHAAMGIALTGVPVIHFTSITIQVMENVQ